MELINISNDPLTGLKRKVELVEFQWNLYSKNIKITTVVHYFNLDDSPIVSKRMTSYRVELNATNTTILTIDNQPVGEYDYYVNIYSNNALILPDVITNIILERDTIQKRFDI